MRASPSTGDHEVLLFADDQNLVDRFGDRSIGLDPDDILISPCPLLVDGTTERLIGRCDCGVIGCGDVLVRVSVDRDTVTWSALHVAGAEVCFELAAYRREIERALHDHSWETPERTTSRLVRLGVDRRRLREYGLSFSWASGRAAPGRLTVALWLEPGPYQLLVHVPYTDLDPARTSADQVLAVLATPPPSWPDVEWLPQAPGIGAPAIAGAGWRRWRG